MKLLLLSLLLPLTASFTPTFLPPTTSLSATTTSLSLFGGKKPAADISGGKNPLGKMGGMMDQFKKAQEIAKKTQAMQQELAAIEMVGSGAGGGVKCVMNGQQKPLKIEFDDEYYGSADAATTSADVMAAMNDAHEKSIKVMTEKMQSLYAELGMPQAPAA